jgi:hypothetical protein
MRFFLVAKTLFAAGLSPPCCATHLFGTQRTMVELAVSVSELKENIDHHKM